MTLFGFRIKARFWVILGGVVLVLFTIFYLKSNQDEPYNPIQEPYFPVSKLPKVAQDPNWMQPFISSYGIQEPQDYSAIEALSANAGYPFKVRVYIPSQEDALDRPDLSAVQYGWRFVPAVFLDPSETLTKEALPNKTNELTAGVPMVIGFPEQSALTQGSPYEVTGLLYWHSAPLIPADEQLGPSSPVLLASSARVISPVELAAPATHRADLNISYDQNNMRINLKSVEWSSGLEARVCVSIANTGNMPVEPWQGLSAFRAEYSSGAGSSGGEPDVYSPLGTQETMDPGVTTTGYIVFENPPLSSPDEGMTLTVPPLNAGIQGIGTQLRITPDQFKSTSEIDRAARGAASSQCYSG